jgi:hypothetical protein
MVIGFSVDRTDLLHMAIAVGSWSVGGPCAESAGSEAEVAMTSERLTSGTDREWPLLKASCELTAIPIPVPTALAAGATGHRRNSRRPRTLSRSVVQSPRRRPVDNVLMAARR